MVSDEKTHLGYRFLGSWSVVDSRLELLQHIAAAILNSPDNLISRKLVNRCHA